MILVHVTSDDRVASIFANGLRGPSCWSMDEKIVAAYTVKTLHERKTPAWIMTSLELFEPSVLQPDIPSIYEPVLAALDCTEEDISRAWETAPNADWRDSLKIVKSLVIAATIPPHYLKLAESPKNLIYELMNQSQSF
jgi:hypothetical protein